MIKKIIKVLCFSCFCLLAAACGERENVYFQTETSVAGTQQNEDVAATEIMAENNADDTQTAGSDKKRFVYICGAVNVPGVYEVEQNARLYEVVEAAGGLREDAAEESVNQARQIEDGEMIRILTQEEAAQAGDEEAGEGAENDVKAETANDSDGRIDLNLATVAELMTLPGIGQAKADSIVRYREKNGAFSSIEEIKQVEGVKEGVYNRIKDNIKVK
jgi:competence protein ComEA